jgi:hypothetical protein
MECLHAWGAVDNVRQALGRAVHDAQCRLLLLRVQSRPRLRRQHALKRHCAKVPCAARQTMAIAMTTSAHVPKGGAKGLGSTHRAGPSPPMASSDRTAWAGGEGHAHMVRR